MIPARPASPSSFRPEALSRTGIAADYAAVAVIGALYLLYGLDAYGVLNNNEALYAEMAREMLEGGSFGVPTLNGVPYLEKPPLLPWLAAAASALFGPSEIALRCVPVAATAALIFATARFAAGHVRPAVGWLSGLILASSFCQLVVQRTLLPDVLLALFFSLGILAAVRVLAGCADCTTFPRGIEACPPHGALPGAPRGSGAGAGDAPRVAREANR